MPNKIMAIVLAVSDLQETIDFYQNKLGLNLKTKEEDFDIVKYSDDLNGIKIYKQVLGKF